MTNAIKPSLSFSPPAWMRTHSAVLQALWDMQIAALPFKSVGLMSPQEREAIRKQCRQGIFPIDKFIPQDGKQHYISANTQRGVGYLMVDHEIVLRF